MNENIKLFIKNNESELFQLLRELCAIPAPSNHEEARAEYCKYWLENIGAKGVYIDDALNVVLPIDCEGSNNITTYFAHTDTVFSDTEPMPFIDDGDILRSPSICDDTASLAVLMMCAKYIIENNVHVDGGLLFVCNSGEEGLGNLKGARQIFKDFDGRISRLISFDSLFDDIAVRCVGSHRYEVTATTEGGHSYLDFGKKNAIAALAEIVSELYKIEIPAIDDSKTTLNVGTISGGTSVNTIAQKATMLCEYRSDNVRCLEHMKKEFIRVFENATNDEVKISAKIIGDRPCAAEMDTSHIEKMYEICKDIIEDVAKNKVNRISSSTDCNIPLSLGIPAICVAVCDGGGRHTREEWLKKSSLPKGLEIGLRIIFALEENK